MEKSSQKLQENSLNVQVTLEPTYIDIGPKDAKHQLLMVHGFNQTAQDFYHDFFKVIPENWRVVIPNGLFFSPQKKRESRGFRIGYAWYFYDLGEDRYYTKTGPSMIYLKTLAESLELKNVTMLGYSQGAYVTPKAAAEISEVKNIICLNGGFKSIVITDEFSYYVYALNGEGDLVVNSSQAKKTFEAWIGGSGRGQIELLSEAGHRIDERFLRRLVEIFKEIEQRS